jgi:hypothetical protein
MHVGAKHESSVPRRDMRRRSKAHSSLTHTFNPASNGVSYLALLSQLKYRSKSLSINILKIRAHVRCIIQNCLILIGHYKIVDCSLRGDVALIRST